MSFTPRITVAEANAILEAAFGGGQCDAAHLIIYNGTQPATGGGAITTQTALVTFVMNATAFGAASGGAIIANAVASVTAAVSGTATWFRLFKSDNTTPLLDGSVGVGAGFDVLIDSASIVSGAAISMTSFSITMPQS